MDYALGHTDVNKDGFVDYLEYKSSNVKATKSSSATAPEKGSAATK